MEDEGVKKGLTHYISWLHWRISGSFVVIVLFSLWWVIPTLDRWRADKMVDELCAKDGGSKIYEVIKLPAEKYNTYWLLNLPSVEYAEDGTDYYLVSSDKDIQGNKDKAHLNELVIWRSENKIIRATDKKIMAKLVSYTRRGGDPIGPWHPSHYTCPSEGFTGNVFVKN